jgi:hypothetical protein
MTVIAHQAAPGRAVRQRPRFFIGVAVATLMLVVVGSARTFYLRPFFGAVDAPTGGTALPWHLLVHGLVMTAWFAFVVTQTLLIAKRNVALHRRLGIAGAALAVLVIAVGMFTVAEFLARRDVLKIATGEQQYGVVVGDTLVMLVYFPLLVAAGLYLRRDAAAHKRLMLLSSLVMLGPVLARYASLFRMAGLPPYLLVAVSPIPLLVALLGYDIATRRRPHWATLCGTLMVALYVPIRNGLVNTNAAAAYIEWLRHLV